MSGALRITAASVVVIVAAVALAATLGSHYSAMNRDWYEGLKRPPWQPPNWAFPVVWTLIYMLCIASLILIWGVRPHTALTWWAIGAFVVNGALNVSWSAIFFGNRLIVPAVYDAGLLFLSTVLVMALAWGISRTASLLLAPYALWVAFATFLTATIAKLNP